MEARILDLGVVRLRQDIMVNYRRRWDGTDSLYLVFIPDEGVLRPTSEYATYRRNNQGRWQWVVIDPSDGWRYERRPLLPHELLAALEFITEREGRKAAGVTLEVEMRYECRDPDEEGFTTVSLLLYGLEPIRNLKGFVAQMFRRLSDRAEQAQHGLPGTLELTPIPAECRIC